MKLLVEKLKEASICEDLNFFCQNFNQRLAFQEFSFFNRMWLNKK